MTKQVREGPCNHEVFVLNGGDRPSVYFTGVSALRRLSGVMSEMVTGCSEPLEE